MFCRFCFDFGQEFGSSGGRFCIVNLLLDSLEKGIVFFRLFPCAILSMQLWLQDNNYG